MRYAFGMLRRPARLPVAALVGFLLLSLISIAAKSETLPPTETVNRLHAALIDVMQNAGALGFAGRRERLSPVIKKSFEFAFISQVVLGRFWADLPETDRARMIDTFTRLTLATYASRFDGYSGEQFQQVEVKPMNRGRILVRTELVRSGKEPVQLDYVLQEENNQWLIVNVVANGVSDLSLKRADYGSVMKSHGFDGLMERLQAQITELGGG